MKDYTKYNFAAIIGAEVEFETCLFETIYNGTLLAYTDDSILIEKTSGGFARISKTNIRHDSLSAEIKVEDMSVKQLERHFKFDCDTHLVLNACEANTCRFVNGGLADISAPTALSAKIDCTNWGWK